MLPFALPATLPVRCLKKVGNVADKRDNTTRIGTCQPETVHQGDASVAGGTTACWPMRETPVACATGESGSPAKRARPPLLLLPSPPPAERAKGREGTRCGVVANEPVHPPRKVAGVCAPPFADALRVRLWPAPSRAWRCPTGAVRLPWAPWRVGVLWRRQPGCAIGTGRCAGHRHGTVFRRRRAGP